MSSTILTAQPSEPFLPPSVANKTPDNFIPIIRLIERQVMKRSQHIALVYGSQQITFDELNKRANQAAHYLQQIGLQKNQFVPVCIHRSIEMMIAMLAILKTGATYVPFHPDHPLDRLEFMLQDLQAKHVFATAASREKLGSYKGRTIEINGKDSVALAKHSSENINVPVNIDDIAYVIYTSGSTGRPKGVIVEHGAMFNYFINSSTRYIQDNNNPSGSYIHLSNTFDASLTALFMPMLAGKAAIISSTSGSDAFNDENFLKYAPYDFIKITPAHLDLLAPTTLNEGTWITKRLVVGGEALYPGHFEFFSKLTSPLEIINEYGPTEATVGCTTYSFWLNDIQSQKCEIPIGAPIDKTAIYLLNKNEGELQPAKAGEICIGGLSLAKGYLNRADLTSEKFIDNPIKNSKWSRLYKTGDLGKWLPDGNLAYCGRVDDQVKISGYRIELGEIENVANQITYINNCCVIAQGDSIKKLVGFVVPFYDKIIKAIDSFSTLGSYNPALMNECHYLSIHQWLQKEIIVYLNDRLPEYMVPNALVFLKQFPLTSSGKIDRKALLTTQSQKAYKSKPLKNATKTEQALINIWQTVLGIDNIQVNDNFFDMGGSSVQAARIFNLLQKNLGCQLPLSTLLSAPTIEELANVVDKPVKQKTGNIFVPYRKMGLKRPLFLIHGGGGDVFFYKKLAELLPNDQPVYAIMPKGLDGKEVAINSIEKMASYYIKKIKEIQSTGPYMLGGYCFGATVAVEMANQLKLNKEEVAFLANINGISPAYMRNKQAELCSNRNQSLKRIRENLKMHVPLINSIGREVILQLKCLKAYLASVLFWKLAAPLVIKLNIPFSTVQAKAYYFWNNDCMMQKHKLKTYRGDMFIFRSALFAREPALGWDLQIDGKINVQEIPGDYTERRDIFNEPYVGALAERLQECLQQAHANYQTA